MTTQDDLRAAAERLPDEVLIELGFVDVSDQNCWGIVCHEHPCGLIRCYDDDMLWWSFRNSDGLIDGGPDPEPQTREDVESWLSRLARG